MKNLRSFPLCVLAGVLLCSFASQAQQAAPAVRIVSPIDESQLVTLTGNVNPRATAKFDRGLVSPEFTLPDLTLVLSRSPEQQAAFDAFVASQYDSSSPNFHQWLTASQIGTKFGPAQADIATVTNWLTSHGLAIHRIAPDGMTIHFGGTAAQVQGAFHTEIHNLSVNGVPHYANMSDPQIPAALSPVIVGVKALHNFLPHPAHKLGSLVQFNKQAGKWQRIADASAAASTSSALKPSSGGLGIASDSTFHPRPLFGTNNGSGTSASLEEDVTPWDFAKIYDLPSGWPTTANGSGQTIAIAGTSFINLGTNTNSNKNSTANDVTTYRSAFGLPAYTTSTAPQEIDAGSYFNTGTTATICSSTSSSICSVGDLTENSLDVEVSGAVAAGAQIDLVVTGNNATGSIDTVFDSASYIVDNETAKIMSVSYLGCELFQGTVGNVAYYDLWEKAASEGISVFVATGDSGSPACDDGQSSSYGDPYVAQLGLTVNGIASTPYDTAVGGTDFSWCQPYYNTTTGDFEGCPTSSTSQGSSAYWATSNNTTTESGGSALGYVPEIPWNDTCENPILAHYIETLLTVTSAGASASTPEQSCSVLYNNYAELDMFLETEYDFDPYFEDYVDTSGGGGGASNCIVNTTDPATQTVGSCTASSTTTGTANGSITLVKDGWPVPSWQTGVTGTSGLTTRAIPDVSFFAGNGALSSATLICVSNNGSCVITVPSDETTQPTAQEIGGTSVASPEMAGVMALINQKAGGAQGLANKELYALAAKQTYSECSAESVKSSSANCYFQDIDNGPTGYSNAQTIAMPCNLTGTLEGGAYQGIASPNCAALTSKDTIGTLVTTTGGTTAAYNSTTGYDLATGLGSLNVANVVNNWASQSGTTPTTTTVTANPTTIVINQALTATVSVTGSGSTPTGTITLTGDGYNSTETIGTSPCTSNTSCTFNVPANSFAADASGATLTADYNGDSTFAESSGTTTITVNVMTPTVTFPSTDPTSGNVANAINFKVTVTGPSGSTAIPGGTVNLKSGTWQSGASALSDGSTVITIPAGSLAAGTDSITATYSGDSNYSGNTGTTSIVMSQVTQLTPTITVTPSPGSIDSGQSLSVTVSVMGSGPVPSGTVTLSATGYTATTETFGNSPCVSNSDCVFTIPANTLSGNSSGESDTLTAKYSGDTNYVAGTGTGTVTVTQSSYTLAATTPAAVNPGTPATSTITGSTTAANTYYSGTVTLSSCTLTSSSVTDPNAPPGCTVTGTITYSSGAPSGTGTANLTTTAASTSDLIRPKVGNGKGWLGAGSGVLLALLVFFGIPARRRSWRSMLCVLIVMAALGGLASCGGGGGGGGGGTTIPGTSAGTYTFTVTGTGNDSANTSETVTFTLTVN